MKRILTAVLFALLVLPASAFAEDSTEKYTVRESSDGGLYYVVNTETGKDGKAYATEGEAKREANRLNRQHKKREKEEENR